MDLSPLATSLIKNVMLEIVAVAAAAGYGAAVSAEAAENPFRRSLLRPYPGVQPRMLADVINGKPLEVEAIVGRDSSDWASQVCVHSPARDCY